jgi:hypothetical protein
VSRAHEGHTAEQEKEGKKEPGDKDGRARGEPITERAVRKERAQVLSH